MSGSRRGRRSTPSVKGSESPLTGMESSACVAIGCVGNGTFPEEAPSDWAEGVISEATEDTEPCSDAEADGADSDSLSLNPTFLEDFFLGLAFGLGLGEGLRALTPSETFLSCSSLTWVRSADIAATASSLLSFFCFLCPPLV